MFNRLRIRKKNEGKAEVKDKSQEIGAERTR